MDKILHSTFNFFTHAIPGFSILVSFIIFFKDIQDLEVLLSFSNRMKIGAGVIILYLSYIIGFSIYPLGRVLYKKVGFKIWKRKFYNNVEGIHLSDKYVLVREKSPLNFKYVESWNMYCAMSSNLAISTLIFFLVSLRNTIKVGLEGNAIWGCMSILSLIAFFLFLHRAVVFSIWAADDLNASIRLNSNS